MSYIKAHLESIGYFDDLPQVDEQQPQECKECNGRGKTWTSCCGDDMYRGNYSDLQICPTCHEHTGDEDDEAETCENCNGTGIEP